MTLLGWLRPLPDMLVRARPVLSVYYAFALLVFGELEASKARLQDAEWWLDATADTGQRPEASAVGMVVANAGRSTPSRRPNAP